MGLLGRMKIKIVYYDVVSSISFPTVRPSFVSANVIKLIL